MFLKDGRVGGQPFRYGSSRVSGVRRSTQEICITDTVSWNKGGRGLEKDLF